jgi:hypothetical protein
VDAGRYRCCGHAHPGGHAQRSLSCDPGTRVAGGVPRR